ncbi:unnamed protein product, partial [marine sediment metagenome]
LSRRIDISYNFGILQGDATFREGDNIYCVGIYPSGPLQVIKISQLAIQRISTDDVEAYITNARLVEGSSLVASGFTTGGKSYYLLTFYRTVGGIISPDITLSFDSMTWGVWETAVSSLAKFPLIGWNIRSGSTVQSGSGIMSNGDLVTITEDYTPVDTITGTAASAYILSGYVAAGYFVTSPGSSGSDENISFKIRSGPYEGKTSRWKFMHNLEIVGDETPTEQTGTIKWMD